MIASIKSPLDLLSQPRKKPKKNPGKSLEEGGQDRQRAAEVAGSGGARVNRRHPYLSIRFWYFVAASDDTWCLPTFSTNPIAALLCFCNRHLVSPYRSTVSIMDRTIVANACTITLSSTS